jgi:hypothetical protein
MGIDAQMVVRKVPRSVVTDEWLKMKSWLLVQAFGKDHFFISKDWYGEGPRLALERTECRYREEGDAPPGTHYSDDGTVELRALDDECLLEVSLCGRYYAEGYERGDIMTYCGIAEWLEQNIQGCEVWYGGDSSGVDLRLFHEGYRKELRKHLFSQHGRDYFAHRFGTYPVEPPACSLCPGSKYRGTQRGSGRDYACFDCPGCGERVESRDNGTTWTIRKD